MLLNDRQALRVLLTAIFTVEADRAADATAVKAVQADILVQTRIILDDLLLEWNQVNGPHRIPSELLAMCFAFLPFHSRVAASRVSRTWRGAALSSPVIWAEIDHPYDDSPAPSGALIKTAVSRAGTLPIHLDYHGIMDAETGVALQSVLHRLRSLKISGRQNTCFLNRPAPLLEYLDLRDAYFPRNFLGGQAGRLRTLNAQQMVLRSTCPALSTVTELCGSFSTQYRSRGVLFALCPRLVSLTLRSELRSTDVGLMGWAPPTLTKLELIPARDCDILAFYNACNVGSLKDVTLRVPVDRAERDISPLIAGALRLRISGTFSHDFIEVTADYASGRRNRVHVGGMTRRRNLANGKPLRLFPPLFSKSASSLALLQSLSVPVTILPDIVADDLPLPALAELRLEISKGMRLKFGGEPTPGFPWCLLSALAHVYVPLVVLDVVCVLQRNNRDVSTQERPVDRGEPAEDMASASDVREMLSELASAAVAAGGSLACSVTVCGFARAAIQHVEIPDCLKGRVSFHLG